MKATILHQMIFGAILIGCPFFSLAQDSIVKGAERAKMHHEIQDQEYLAPAPGLNRTSPAPRLKSTGFFTTQVNVDANGDNILGDAANEPSIAVDPTNPNNIVIGWRQFDNVNSNFRQAGYGYSSDGGLTWTFPGVINPGIFRSDPVLDVDTAGNFFYNSLTNSPNYFCKVYKSTNGGASWDLGVAAKGGDKQWMTIDRTGGVGTGNIYSSWTSYYSTCQPGFFTRSANAGASFESCIEVEGNPYWGTMTVGPDGELYIGGSSWNDGFIVAKSSNAKIPGSTITWDFSTYVDVDGYVTSSAPINPVGLLGQVSIDVDRSNGPGHGNVYVLSSVVRNSNGDPADVMFAKSIDGGWTFGNPQRINTDPGTNSYQWFGTMSVAPNGRIDVIWLDTRLDLPGSYLSALYYCYSDNQGQTWSNNIKLSPLFDPHVGWPQQNKMGDYFDMVSDDAGAHLAWANTLNGEQDVYYSFITPGTVGIEETGSHHDLPNVQSFPNPFRDKTNIRYTVPDESRVKVVICNLYGQEIRTLVDKKQNAGTYDITFADDELPAGFYLCRVSSGEKTMSARLVKIK